MPGTGESRGLGPGSGRDRFRDVTGDRAARLSCRPGTASSFWLLLLLVALTGTGLICTGDSRPRPIVLAARNMGFSRAVMRISPLLAILKPSTLSEDLEVFSALTLSS